MRLLSSFLLVMLLFSNYEGQTPKFGEKPFDLKVINFDLDVGDFYRKVDNIDRIGEVYVEKKKQLEDEKPVHIQYLQQNSSTKDTIAKFENFGFEKLSMVTTVDNKLMSAVAAAEFSDTSEYKKLLAILKRNYGVPKRVIGEFSSKKYPIYIWKLAKKTVKLIMYSEKIGNLGIEMSDSKISKIYSGIESIGIYLYITKKGFEDYVEKNVTKGDFVFIHN
jgi:hypothetical protein